MEDRRRSNLPLVTAYFACNTDSLSDFVVAQVLLLLICDIEDDAATVSDDGARDAILLGIMVSFWGGQTF